VTNWKDKLAEIAQRNRQEIVKANLDRREMMRLGLFEREWNSRREGRS
jgi:hypothetical protein